jgi:AAA family ATP:ADP antiporter
MEDSGMETRPAPKTSRRLFNIKPGEGKLAFLLFAYFFLITAPYTMIKALRTTNFLVKEGVGALPVAYLLATIGTGFVVLFHSRTQLRLSIRAMIIASLVFFAASGLIIQWILQTDFGRRSAFVSYFYWVWASVLIVVLLTHFWMTINELFNPREARRLVGFLNSGGILGAVLGGSLVGLLSEGALGVWLMPLACLMLLGGVLVVRAIFNIRPEAPPATASPTRGGENPAESKVGFRDSFESVRKNRFLALIAGIVAIGVVVSICVEFQFLSAADMHFRGRPSALQSFFGFFDPALTIFAFFLNFLMAGHFIKKLKIVRSLLLTPAVLLACSAAILIGPFALLPGIIIRGADEGLAFSLNHPVREILYIPVATHLRHKAKAFIDMFVNQLAKVAGALVLLLFALLLNKKVEGLTPSFDQELAKNLSWVVIAFLVPWTLLGVKIGKEYLATLRENFRPVGDRAEIALKEKLDVESAKLVFDTIDSRNSSSVLYALHLFDLLARDKLTPELKSMIADKSWEVRAAALNDRFEAEGAGSLPGIPGDAFAEAILTEVPLIMSSEEYQRAMKVYLEKVLRERPGSEIKKMELAKAIGFMDPGTPLAAQLSRLIDDDSPRVSSLAIRSAARLKREDSIPAIVRKLANFSTLEDAVEALHRYGDSAVGALEGVLHDASVGISVRLAAVEVLARDGTQKAVSALTEELEGGTGDLDEGVIDALDRIRSENREIPLSAARKKTFSLIKKYCQAYLDIQSQAPGEVGAGLRHHLDRYLDICFADIFKLLGLYYPQSDIRTVYQNIKTGTRNSVAHAVEWLDNALKKDLKNALLPIVEDLDPTEKTRRFQKILKDVPDL